MLQRAIDSYRAAWRTAKTIYHTAAFLSLIVVVGMAATGRVTGYVSANASTGKQEVSEVSDSQLSRPADQKPAKQKAEKHAEEERRPAEKPVPPPPPQAFPSDPGIVVK